MFLLNVGYRMNLANDLDEIIGAVFLASSHTKFRLERSKYPEFRRMLFDPQLYLAKLDPERSPKACTRLATYPWFGKETAFKYNPEEGSLQEWEMKKREEITSVWPQDYPSQGDITSACSDAMEFQLTLGCTHIILPSPIIEEREDEAITQGDWLDRSLEVAISEEITQPLIATVALDEKIINESAFQESGFLDTIVDQISSRKGIDGVYIVVSQNSNKHPFRTGEDVLRAYATLSKEFSQCGFDIIITNFADIFGLSCLALGASDFATGPSQSLRRLSFEGFQEDVRGTALPHYYSHDNIAEFFSESDLDKLRDKKLLRRLKDHTSHSNQLMESLNSGNSAADIPLWAENKNNLNAAQKHFIIKINNEERSIAPLNQTGKKEAIIDWLENADVNITYIDKKLGSDSIKGEVAPSENWLEIFEAVSTTE